MSELSSNSTAPTTTTTTTTICRRTTMGNHTSSNHKNGGSTFGRHGRHGPAYQIDRQLTHKGKMIAGTKRRVYWKFGFADRDALSSGTKSSIDCRGLEHEIVFVWSLASGKQLLLADGHEVHWGKTRSFEKFEKTWKMDGTAGGGHEIKVVAHASSPLLFDNNATSSSVVSSSSKQFKQYDLIVDGISFSDMPQICDLGSSSYCAGAGAGTGTRTATSSSRESLTPSSSLSSPSLQHRQIHQQQHRHSSGSRISGSRITPTANTRRNLKHYNSQPLLHVDEDLDNTETESLSPSPSMPDLLDTFDQTTGSSSSTPTAPATAQPQHALHATTSTPSFPSHRYDHQQQQQQNQRMYQSQSCLNINLMNMDTSFVSPPRTMYPPPAGACAAATAAATPSRHCPQYATMAVNAMNAATADTTFGASSFSSSSCSTPSTVGLMTPSPVHHHHHQSLSSTSPRSVHDQIIGAMAADGTSSSSSSNPFDAFVVSAPKLPSVAPTIRAAATDATTTPWR